MGAIKTAWRIYCGKAGRGGTYVGEGEFQAFLREVVAPRFESFTVLSGTGFWNAIDEPAAVIEILAESADARCTIEDVATLYKLRFDQDLVLIVNAVCDCAII